MNSHYELPFKVKQLLFWQDRYWAIDENGILRWSEAHDIYNWYTKPKEGTFQKTDAGWWKIEDESIERIAVSTKGLLVRTEKSQYLFTGNTIETYNMEKIGEIPTDEHWYGRFVDGVGLVIMTKEDWEKSKEEVI